MAKNVTEVLEKAKGTDKINEVIAGKGAFSKAGFADLTNALVNDTTFKIDTYGKDGKVNGSVSVSELIRADLKKTMDKANYPQKSEAAVLDTCEIATAGLAEAIPQIVMQQLAAGKKFDLPAQKDLQASIYLQNVPGRVKESTIRDPKTQEVLGSVTTTTKDNIQVKAKTKLSDALVSKVRKDTTGKVVSK